MRFTFKERVFKIADVMTDFICCSKKILNFTVEGDPVALARPRFTRQGHAYEVKECVEAKERVAEACRQAMIENCMATCEKDMPVILTVCFFRPMPKGTKWLTLARELGFLVPTTKHRDLDNCIKLVGDALNGVFYRDDAQIVEIHAYCRYSSTPRTEVRLEGFFVNMLDARKAAETSDY